ncbi:MAG UNVERIFIED_CONTAM: hypothetical protein LVR18_47485 [Planctomycetaceae bacterium]
MVNYRGTYLSEGRWQGYRALGWGTLKDGYDTCEWLGTQTWSTGKVGTFGSSQAGYAQNFLAVTQPPHLAAQYSGRHRTQPVPRRLSNWRNHQAPAIPLYSHRCAANQKIMTCCLQNGSSTPLTMNTGRTKTARCTSIA